MGTDIIVKSYKLRHITIRKRYQRNDLITPALSHRCVRLGSRMLMSNWSACGHMLIASKAGAWMYESIFSCTVISITIDCIALRRDQSSPKECCLASAC